MGRHRRGDPSLQGFATDISVNNGEPFPSRSRATAVSPSTSTGWATTRVSVRARSRRSSRRDAAGADATRVPSRHRRPACSTAATGVCSRTRPARVSWARPEPPRASTSRSSIAVRRARRQPYPLHRSRRRAPGGCGRPDLRHDVAGLQHLRRRKLYCGGPVSNWVRVRRLPGPRRQSQLQPAVQHAGQRRSQSFVFNAEYPMVRFLEANGYDVSYISGVDSDRLGADPGGARSPRSSSRSATTSTGRAGSARTWKRRATRASTWRSSAATKCSGRRGGRPSIDGSGTPYRTLVCYKETHAGNEDRSGVDGGTRFGPAPGATRGSVRRPTAAARRTPSPARSGRSTREPRAITRAGRDEGPCGSGATRESRL